MNLFGLDIRWADPPPETRSLEQLSDIGLAFAVTQAALEGQTDTTIPAVYRAAQILTDLVAALPIREVGVDGVESPVQPNICVRPNTRETYQATMAKVVSSLVFRGNAYIRPLTFNGDGSIASAHVLHPDEVLVAWDKNQLWPVYSWRDQTMEPGRNLFHVAINHWPGHLKGVGPITAARLTYQGIMAEQNMARRLYEDDATPSGTLNVPQRLEKEEAEAVQTSWEEAHGGRKRPAVLSGGVTFDQITINPVDAQFIESRQFSVQEVARMFGLPGSFLLVDSGGSLTYNNPEALFQLFLKLTLNPTYLEPIQQVWSLMLPGGNTARFDPSEILTPDIEARYRAYELGLVNGFLTVDEVRRELGRPRIEPAAKPAGVPV